MPVEPSPPAQRPVNELSQQGAIASLERRTLKQVIQKDIGVGLPRLNLEEDFNRKLPAAPWVIS